MTPLKGGHVLIAAAARAARVLGRPVRIIMAGDGPQKEAWRSLASSLGVQLEMTGWVAPEDRARVYGRGLLVAVPSLWPEPFGLAGLDAASLGRPAVAFDVGGIGEWLTDGLNGRLVDPGAGEDGLARAIVSLLGEPRERERMGQRALEVSRRMSVAAHVERLESVLGDAARREPRGASRHCEPRAQSAMHWTILTCEYPPDCGGVGDYTAQVAAALVAAGDDGHGRLPAEVRVRCSAARRRASTRPASRWWFSTTSTAGSAGARSTSDWTGVRRRLRQPFWSNTCRPDSAFEGRTFPGAAGSSSARGDMGTTCA